MLPQSAPYIQFKQLVNSSSLWRGGLLAKETSKDPVISTIMHYVKLITSIEVS